MLEFAELLTLNPSSVTEGDVDRLREAGFGDADIVDIVHVVGMFSYFVRIADGLGIELEPERAYQAPELPFYSDTPRKAAGHSVSL